MSKYDFFLNIPLMNAAGFLGFAPDTRGPVDLSTLGAFVTNPVSLDPRTPAHGPRYTGLTGGFMLHTGHPNPGFKAMLRRYAAQWSRSPLPVVVHLLARGVEDAGRMARQLENVDGVMAIELGLPPEAGSDLAAALLEAARGELPVVVRVPLERAAPLAAALSKAGAAAISLGAPRGAMPGANQKLLTGRIYGPAVFPFALEAVRALAQSGTPVIGAGGVYTPEQAEAMLAAGALAVQLDAVLWKGGWAVEGPSRSGALSQGNPAYES